ncbi:unnamed protein product [Musa hybrid cultivar]
MPTPRSSTGSTSALRLPAPPTYPLPLSTASPLPSKTYSTSVAASPGSATRTGRRRTRQRRPHLPLFSLLSELAPHAWAKLSWTRWHTASMVRTIIMAHPLIRVLLIESLEDRPVDLL